MTKGRGILKVNGKLRKILKEGHKIRKPRGFRKIIKEGHKIRKPRLF